MLEILSHFRPVDILRCISALPIHTVVPIGMDLANHHFPNCFSIDPISLRYVRAVLSSSSSGMELAIPDLVVLRFSTSGGVARLLSHLEYRVIPVPFDHLLPPYSLHLVRSLNHISVIHNSFPSGNLTFFLCCNIIIYLVGVSVVVRGPWWFNNWNNVVGAKRPSIKGLWR